MLIKVGRVKIIIDFLCILIPSIVEIIYKKHIVIPIIFEQIVANIKLLAL